MNTKTKKIVAVVLAMVLVSACSILGTLAYLKKTTDAVTNTFTAVSGIVTPTDDPNPANPDDNSGFYLYESNVDLDDGEYEFDDDYVFSNTYDKVVPGMVIPKNPTITANISEDVGAFVFVEVVDTTNGALTYSLTSDWTKLDGIVGPNGGDVYSYGTTAIIGTDAVEIEEAGVIDGDQVIAGDDLSNLSADTLSFKAFVCQSNGFDTAADAFTACFLAD